MWFYVAKTMKGIDRIENNGCKNVNKLREGGGSYKKATQHLPLTLSFLFLNFCNLM